MLGIDVPAGDGPADPDGLGLPGDWRPTQATVQVVPPSWRRDLEREIDLVEEVARIHGYEQIPEDVAVPMAPSHRSDDDRVLGQGAAGPGGGRVRRSDDRHASSRRNCPTPSAPGRTAAPLRASTPMLKGADLVRRSLVPSLLATPPRERVAGQSGDRIVRDGTDLPAAGAATCRASSGRWR